MSRQLAAHRWPGPDTAGPRAPDMPACIWARGEPGHRPLPPPPVRTGPPRPAQARAPPRSPRRTHLGRCASRPRLAGAGAGLSRPWGAEALTALPEGPGGAGSGPGGGGGGAGGSRASAGGSGGGRFSPTGPRLGGRPSREMLLRKKSAAWRRRKSPRLRSACGGALATWPGPGAAPGAPPAAAAAILRLSPRAAHRRPRRRPRARARAHSPLATTRPHANDRCRTRPLASAEAPWVLEGAR